MTATTMNMDIPSDGASHTALGAMVDTRVVALTDPDSAAGEQYRMLRHRLERIVQERAVRCFGITSATCGEGKTTTAVNLALAVGVQPGRRVALIDMDLRGGRVHRMLGFAPRQGLADVLLGTASPRDVLWRFAESGLVVLPSGLAPADPAALLASPAAHELMAALRQSFDVVILDMPALLPTADAQVGIDLCEGVLLVVKSGSTSREVVELALDAVPAQKLCGCILNAVAPHESAELAPAFAAQRPRARASRQLLPADEEAQAAAPGGRTALPAST
jgi:capsular exopolysaccharide synthesis family protein